MDKKYDNMKTFLKILVFMFILTACTVSHSIPTNTPIIQAGYGDDDNYLKELSLKL